MSGQPRVAVIGLGYVGLPLAIALAGHGRVLGFDRDPERIAELAAGFDRTREVPPDALAETSLELSAEPEDLRGHDVVIVAVPTPVDAANQPDLGSLRAACRTLGPRLAPGAIVVFESTVFPGCTEEVCGPELAAASDLEIGRDIWLGYAPERINPGDAAHGLGHIVKVVAGQTPAVAARLAELYGRIVPAGVFVARDIRTAEAAKVIENAQRDINIAFVNEVAMICARLGLSVHDVLAAARTKWNFLDFTPGLVGGHCIGVDPYYLAHKARAVGHEPHIVLAGRAINEAMPAFVAEQIAARLEPGARILVLGLTFKENVPDLRNSKTAELVHALQARGFELTVHDPLADPGEARRLYRIDLQAGPMPEGRFDALVAAVPHRAYRYVDATGVAALLTPNGLLADIKGLWRDLALPRDVRRWTL